MTQLLDVPPSERKTPAVDLAVVKARQRSMWDSGDYAVIGATLQIVGESLCEAVDLEAGSRVLDVAARAVQRPDLRCGLSLPAAASARRVAADAVGRSRDRARAAR